ncbi:MAG: outer membrane protein assembly factor BamE [Rubritepida sp.]|jgi:outer membrane protein assembly factor BamE (lipoprotein component of BamABCDE complex)|nr:outer membrane protein assembly factor BamE [Rubritepida sp.]MCU0943826.1 outer membrane protein assembly factor BamE [Rubritepida sp.]
MASAARTVNLRAALVLGSVLLAAGCGPIAGVPMPDRPSEIFSAPVTARGHLVTDEQLGQLTPGVSTRQDVRALLGSPSHAGTFSDDAWYYISAMSHIRPARSLAVYDRRVVVVDFNPAGTVTGVRRLGEPDMPRVALVARETPTPGTEQTFLQRIFGGVGRVGPAAAATAGQQSPGSGPGR